MKAFAFLLVLIVSLLYISPFYSMYQIGNSIKSDDKETLNLYTSWPELQASVKEDLELFLKNREELRKKEKELKSMEAERLLKIKAEQEQERELILQQEKLKKLEQEEEIARKEKLDEEENTYYCYHNNIHRSFFYFTY